MMKRFRKDEEGGMTLEAVLWVPVILSFTVWTADASVMFMNKARVEKIVLDGQRSLAVGRFADCAELESWVETQTRTIAETATATCVPGKRQARTTVSLSAAEMDLTGSSGFMGDMQLAVQTFQTSERGTN